MGDFEQGRQQGLGGGWNPHADRAGQIEGQREREAQDAAWRERINGDDHGAVAGRGRSEGASPLAVLAAVALAGYGLFAMRHTLLAAGGMALLVGVGAFVGLRLAGARPRWWSPFVHAGVACALMVAAFLIAAVIVRLLDKVGPNLAPGLEISFRNGRVQMAGSGAQSFIIPYLAALAAGVAWLDRSLPRTFFPKPLRWTGLTLLLIAAWYLAPRMIGAIFA